jgi:hypothetical protein
MPAPKPVRIHQVAKKVAPKVAAKHSNPNSDPEIDAESEKIKKMKFSVGLDFNDRRIISNARSQMSEMAMDRNDEIASGEINYLNDSDRRAEIISDTFRNLNANSNSTSAISRIFGSLQAVGGVLEIAAGLVAADTGLLAVPGALAVTGGVDNLIAGVRSVYSGRSTRTGLENIGQSYSISDRVVQFTELGMGLAPGIPGLTRGIQYFAADSYYEMNKLPPLAGRASARVESMLQENIGYNISSERAFDPERLTLGTKKSGTWISDFKTAADVLGDVNVNEKFTVGFFSSGTKVSYFRTRLLEHAFALNPSYRLMDGFRLSQIKQISRYNPRLPLALEGNERFVEGAGLPFGGPELIIKPPISNNPWPLR